MSIIRNANRNNKITSRQQQSINANINLSVDATTTTQKNTSQPLMLGFLVDTSDSMRNSRIKAVLESMEEIIDSEDIIR